MTEIDDPTGNLHPEDLLPAYALNALPEAEALEVESHLDFCSACREEAAQLLGTVVFLSQAVERQNPPFELASRLMVALARAMPQSAASVPVVSVVPGALFFGLRHCPGQGHHQAGHPVGRAGQLRFTGTPAGLWDIH